MFVIIGIFAVNNIMAFDPQKGHGKDGKGPDVKPNHWYPEDYKKKLNYDSLWATAKDIEQSKEGRDLILNCFKAYGGEDHLKEINTLTFKYHSQVKIIDKQQTITNYFEKGLKHKVNVVDTKSSITRTLNDKKAWANNKELYKPLLEEGYQREVFDYLCMSMPIGIKTESFEQTKFGEREGDDLKYIYLKKDSFLIVIIGIDPSDYMIKKIEGVIHKGDKRYVHINHYSDFNMVDGFIFPHTKQYISMGLEVSTSTITDIEINPAFEENFFKSKDEWH